MCTSYAFKPRKLKGDYALHAILEKELVYLRIFLFLCLSKQSLAVCDALSHKLISYILSCCKCKARGVCIIYTKTNRRYNNLSSKCEHQNGGHRQSVSQWAKRDPIPLLTSLISTHQHSSDYSQAHYVQEMKSLFPKPLTSTPTCYSFAAQVTAK